MVRASSLQKYALFGGLLEEQINNIIPLMKEEVYNPEDFLIVEGKANDKIFFLLEGHVAVTRNDIELTHFGEGEAIGEMEVLDVMPAVASIRALSHVKVISISNKALREIYKLDVKTFSLIIMNLARDLSRRLRKMDEKLADTPILI